MEEKQYCKFCDEQSMVLRQNRKNESWFYACSNYNDPGKKCTNTYTAGQPHEAEQAPAGEYQPTEEALKIEQEKLKASQERFTVEAEAWALKKGTLGPAAIERILKNQIPGFGKKYEDLTQADRDLRAEYIFPFVNKAIKKMNGVPYDKNSKVADE